MLAFLFATGNRPYANKSMKRMREAMKENSSWGNNNILSKLSPSFIAFVKQSLIVEHRERISAEDFGRHEILKSLARNLFAEMNLLISFRENLNMYLSSLKSSSAGVETVRKMSEDMAACIIQRTFCKFTERRNVALEQQILLMERRENSAVMIQSLARRFLSRCLYSRLSKTKFEDKARQPSCQTRSGKEEGKEGSLSRDNLSLDLSKIVGVSKASAEGKSLWKGKGRVPRVREIVQQDRKERSSNQEPPRKDRKINKVRPNDKLNTIHTFDQVVERQLVAPPPKLFKTLHHPRIEKPTKKEAKHAALKKLTGRDTLFLADDSFREAHDEWVLEALASNALAPKSSSSPLDVGAGWEDEVPMSSVQRGASAFDFTDFGSEQVQAMEEEVQGMLLAPEIESDGEEEEQVVKSVLERRKKLLEITTASHRLGSSRYQQLHAATISRYSSLQGEYEHTHLPQVTAVPSRRPLTLLLQLGTRSKSLSARGSDAPNASKASLLQHLLS
mmetsp:Transcript_24121/g.78495  ORF Transcript_24121/g.78495 Transcript_24121/m.78495 type:complete len:504 (-) Transcript_24121:573-2084(-)